MDAWRRWRTWLKATKRPSTVASYSGNVLRFLAETGCLDLEAYTEDHCTWFFSDKGWVTRGKAKYDYSKAINSFFRWCVRRGFLPSNPNEGVEMRKPRRVKPVALTEEEVRRVVYAAAVLLGERQAWGILLIYLLGVRRMEAAGLKWEHVRVDPRGPVIEIHETKGATERDALPLCPLAVECLAHLRELERDPRVRRGPEYILGVERATISRWVHVAATAAGLERRKVDSHRLRASVATNALRASVDIRAVQRLLGHEDLASTAWYIEEANDDEVRAGMDVVASRVAS